MLDTLTQLVGTYGPLTVGLFVLLESAGLPLPGETTLLVAAATAGAQHRSIGAVIAVAAGAAIVGDAGGYWLGRRGGRPVLDDSGARIPTHNPQPPIHHVWGIHTLSDTGFCTSTPNHPLREILEASPHSKATPPALVRKPNGDRGPTLCISFRETSR